MSVTEWLMHVSGEALASNAYSCLVVFFVLNYQEDVLRDFRTVNICLMRFPAVIYPSGR